MADLPDINNLPDINIDVNVIHLGEPKFTELVRDELAAARENFRDMASAHEGYAVLAEEVDEMWDQVKVNQKRRDPGAMLSELVQVAAMAQRMAEDIIFGNRIDQ